ncbi:crAss001_48 related protein [Veillonella parvula]|uniref:crAss001_48 related protein n=1 Tax=Veillonella parvula TaxID=29466 RepID=UPI003AB6D18A
MIRIWEETSIENLEQNLANMKQTEIKEPEWQTRFRIEYSELKERYNKLHKMLVKYDAGTLEFKPTCPIELLRKQKATMGEYLNILEIRAEIEKVTL